MRWGSALGLVSALACGVFGPTNVLAQTTAQTPSASSVSSPEPASQKAILTIEPERLFVESDYGQAIAAQIDAESARLAAENRQIEAELTAEESDLAQRRPSLSTDDFRALAEAFDDKVTRLRREQDAKARALTQSSETARRTFFSAIQPVLGELLSESGASIILERRSVFLSLDSIDITDQAIARINAVQVRAQP